MCQFRAPRGPYTATLGLPSDVPDLRRDLPHHVGGRTGRHNERILSVLKHVNDLQPQIRTTVPVRPHLDRGSSPPPTLAVPVVGRVRDLPYSPRGPWDPRRSRPVSGVSWDPVPVWFPLYLGGTYTVPPEMKYDPVLECGDRGDYTTHPLPMSLLVERVPKTLKVPCPTTGVPDRRDGGRTPSGESRPRSKTGKVTSLLLPTLSLKQGNKIFQSPPRKPPPSPRTWTE